MRNIGILQKAMAQLKRQVRRGFTFPCEICQRAESAAWSSDATVEIRGLHLPLNTRICEGCLTQLNLNIKKLVAIDEKQGVTDER